MLDEGFACILAKWFWPTVMGLSLTYGSPEASCNKRADTYFGRRSASLMKEFWTLCICKGCVCVVLAYCDGSLSYIWKSRGLM